MKVLVEVANKKISNYVDCCDALLLGLENFSVLNSVTFSVDEIRKITKDYPDIDVFVKMDKNLFNDEINDVRHVLQELEQMSIRGVFFYDLAILELKQELSLSLDLVWSQTHMVTNYRTCDYYYQQGVHYALLSKEITLDEILAIVKKSSILSIVEVVSLPSVGYSRRKLLSNYYKDLEEDSHSTLSILEKITDKKYLVKEEDAGTGIFLDEVLNGTSVIKPLYEAGVSYILFREEGISSFMELINDTKNYIDGGCVDTDYVSKYKKLGDSTGFFFKKTIYRVKK
jgi:collagenase-like PrtC family protease